MYLLIVLVSLVLTIWDILPKYSKMIISSFLATEGTFGIWIYILVRTFWMHWSRNFCGYAFFDKIFLSLSTSWWNFKKSEDKLKQRFNKVCNKDSFEFAKDITNQNSNSFMVSLDVDSLFTNVPLDESIKICIDELFKSDMTVSGLNEREMFEMLSFCLITNITVKLMELPWVLL